MGLNKLSLVIAAILFFLLPGETRPSSDFPFSVVKLSSGSEFKGTGFIINEDGCILTNSHVVVYNRVQVETAYNRHAVAYDLKASNPVYDLAVLCPSQPTTVNTYFTFKRIPKRDIQKINKRLKLIGFDKKEWDYVEHHIHISDIVDFALSPSVHVNSYMINWDTKEKNKAIKTGYSGSPAFEGGGVIGVLATCWMKQFVITKCYLINSHRIIDFLASEDIKFYENTDQVSLKLQ